MSRSAARLFVIVTCLSVAGCNNPLWRFDRVRIQGVMDGATCRVWVDGKPFHSKGDAHDSAMSLAPAMRQDEGHPPTWFIDMFSCNEITASVVRDGDGWPRKATRRVAEGLPGPGDISISLSGTDHTNGLWPLHIGEPLLVGVRGTVVIDSVASDGWNVTEKLRRPEAIWGRFDFIARRM